MHSTVREQAGIGFAAQTSATSYSLADVHLSGGLPGGEVAVYFSPEGSCQRAFPRRDLQDRGQRGRSPAHANPRLHPGPGGRARPAGRTVIVQDMVWGSRFRIHYGVADRFQTGRVALAGGAAHDSSPLGGQGMNVGIGDAAALGAALDAAIERGSPARSTPTQPPAGPSPGRS
jgi:2-polyprenyl-6-methoxyphenol hydroxylase-like FAD-dependent oxidoreductase